MLHGVVLFILLFIVVYFLLVLAACIHFIGPCWMQGRLKKENISCKIKNKYLLLPKVEMRSKNAHLLELEEKIEISKEKTKIGVIFTVIAAIIGTTIILYIPEPIVIAIVVPAVLYIFNEFVIDEISKKVEYNCYLKRFGNIKGYRLNQMRLYDGYEHKK